MTTHATTPQVRAAILGAARRVLVRDGAEHLTVAAAAREAGLSTGGLRYHFESKRDLLAGLVRAMIDGFESALRAAPEQPGARTLAYIAATLDPPGSAGDDATVGFLAAVGADRELLTELRSHYSEWQAMLDDDGIDPAVATVVRLAIDGWWLAVVADLAPPPPERARVLRRHLEGLVAKAVR